MPDGSVMTLARGSVLISSSERILQIYQSMGHLSHSFTYPPMDEAESASRSALGFGGALRVSTPSLEPSDPALTTNTLSIRPSAVCLSNCETAAWAP